MAGHIVSAKALRAYERRAATARRIGKERRDGSQGPAGPCKRIDPVTGEVLGVLEHVKPRSLATASPTLGAPALGIVPAGTIRQRNKRQRDAQGIKPITITPNDYALCEALIVSERLSEADALDDIKVTAAVTEIVNEWARRWRNQM